MRARQTPRMVVLSSNWRRIASLFSGVTALDLGLMEKVLSQSLHLARCVLDAVLPYLTTGSACWQWGQRMVIVIMPQYPTFRQNINTKNYKTQIEDEFRDILGVNQNI